MRSLPGKYEFYSVAARGCAVIEAGRAAPLQASKRVGRAAFGTGQIAGSLD